MGLNTAHKFAFNYAKKKYDYLITMDADLSHSTKYIRKIIKLLNKNDFVIGSRYMNGGGLRTQGISTYYLSYVGHSKLDEIYVGFTTIIALTTSC